MSSIEIPRDYDVVGNYSQDEVNGFTRDVIPAMLDAIVNFYPKNILDCMAGNGNLSEACIKTFKDHEISQPNMEILEFSRVQSEIARKLLEPKGVRVWNGDVLSMKTHNGQDLFVDNYFDCIMIKSSNHEIPLNLQPQMYAQLFRVLKPGGLFINLGFSFEDKQARNEVRQLALCKDSLGGLSGAVSNRHFLMRDEYYEFLNKAGFTNVRPLKEFFYNISADRVSKNYFPNDNSKRQAFRNALIESTYLQENRSIERIGDDVAFLARGEITLAYKP